MSGSTLHKGLSTGGPGRANRSLQGRLQRIRSRGSVWDFTPEGAKIYLGGLSTGAWPLGGQTFNGRLRVFRGRAFDGRARPGSENHSPADPPACALPGETATDRARPSGQRHNRSFEHSLVRSAPSIEHMLGRSALRTQPQPASRSVHQPPADPPVSRLSRGAQGPRG